jgi:hypothetical protein
MTRPYSPPTSITHRGLVLGILAGPLAWGGYFLLGYLLSDAACFLGLLRGEVLGLDLLSLVVILLSLPFLAASIYFAFRTYRTWRVAKQREQEMEAYDYNQFLSLSGFTLNILFILAIILTAAPLFFLQPCVWS